MKVKPSFLSRKALSVVLNSSFREINSSSDITDALEVTLVVTAEPHLLIQRTLTGSTLVSRP